jgi:hypothetical protein
VTAPNGGREIPTRDAAPPAPDPRRVVSVAVSPRAGSRMAESARENSPRSESDVATIESAQTATRPSRE